MKQNDHKHRNCARLLLTTYVRECIFLLLAQLNPKYSVVLKETDVNIAYVALSIKLFLYYKPAKLLTSHWFG